MPSLTNCTLPVCNDGISGRSDDKKYCRINGPGNFTCNDRLRWEAAYSLPNVEVFYAEAGLLHNLDTDEPLEAGWYYAYGFPGCLWDGEPVGPFATETDALADARDSMDEGEN